MVVSSRLWHSEDSQRWVQPMSASDWEMLLQEDRPLLALFALHRARLLSLVQKSQQAEGKWLLEGGRRGGEGMAIPASKEEEPRDFNRAKRRVQVDPVTKKRSRLCVMVSPQTTTRTMQLLAHSPLVGLGTE